MPKKIPVYRPPGMGPRLTKQEADRLYNRTRRDPFLLKLYSTARWKKFRAMIRAERVLCEACKAEGRTELGEYVHHVVDPRDNPDLAFDETNVKLWCASHHSRHHAYGRQ